MPRKLTRSPSPVTLQTTNLIKLYEHLVGKSEVPTQFHLWCCLATIAACVQDRVWVEKFKGSRLTPNLYVVLLGPSGCGKGKAIDIATAFVQHLKRVNMYRGKSTAPFLIDYMGRRRKVASGESVLENPKLFLVTPELSMSVGSGPFADDFIKLMTELFTGGEYLFQAGTRTRGNVTIRGHCINWLGGTTREWFVQSLSRDAIEGGALARIVLVPADYDFALRYVRPVVPPNYEWLQEHIQARFLLLTALQAQPFAMTTDAREVEEQWYYERKAPEDDALYPTFRRQHDLLLKLSMLLALADGGELIITRPHVVAAKTLVSAAEHAVPDVVSLASMPPEAGGFIMVRDTIQRLGRVRRSVLTQKCSRRGISAAKIDEHVRTLRAANIIRMFHAERATWYEWKRRWVALDVGDVGETESDNGDEAQDVCEVPREEQGTEVQDVQPSVSGPSGD